MMSSSASRQDSPMVDEMFDGAQMEIAEAEAEDAAGTSQGQHGQAGQQQQGQQVNAASQAATLMHELTYSERTVHAEFKKDFGELYDDKNLQ